MERVLSHYLYVLLRRLAQNLERDEDAVSNQEAVVTVRQLPDILVEHVVIELEDLIACGQQIRASLKLLELGTDAQVPDLPFLDLQQQRFQQSSPARVGNAALVQKENIDVIGSQFPQASLQTPEGRFRGESAGFH